MTENSRRVVAHPANDRDGMTQTNDISGKRPGRKREIPPCPVESILISAAHGRIENAPSHVAHGSVGKLAASWIRFSSSSAMFQFRRPRNISAANSVFKTRSTTASASSHTVHEPDVSGDPIGSSF